MTKALNIWILVLIRVAFVIGAAYAFFVTNDYETGGLVTVGLILSFLPQLIERQFSVDLPVRYEMVIVLFVFASMFLGEFVDAYERYWWWDKVLHLSSGVIIGYVGFIILHMLYLKGKLRISPAMIAFFTFSVGMASAGVWEMMEYASDNFLGTTMQHGLDDTMIDIILAAAGSVAAAGVAYWHHRWPESSPVRRWVKKFLQLNPAAPEAARSQSKRLKSDDNKSRP